MPNYEALQFIAKTRYGMDVPGALKKALENGTPGITGNTTDINGLALIAHNQTQDPDLTAAEWHRSGTGSGDVFGSVAFVLTFSAAP